MAKKAQRHWSTLLTPAPGELAPVQALLNSDDRVTGRDELAGPAQLSGWLARWRLAPADAETTADDLERLLDLRRALRTLLAVGPGAGRHPACPAGAGGGAGADAGAGGPGIGR